MYLKDLSSSFTAARLLVGL